MTDHERYMRLALAEAKKAGQFQEIPIGAVLVAHDGSILAAEFNQSIRRADPTAHAEILAIRTASQTRENYRLTGTRLYVSIEPCVMCMGAIIHARIAELIFGAYDPKWGAAGSLYRFHEDVRFNHHPKVIAGILSDECRALIQNFFRYRRSALNWK